ncbi:MAG: tetratricopeptide repeat protein [Proteobacteria bacterium]|nr:tetratricopeptide repeat protein [Pseudomonadota bacterium]MBU1641601.1 tetratricopeptide repeat protein [Pseudomonadota bacterium]
MLKDDLQSTLRLLFQQPLILMGLCLLLGVYGCEQGDNNTDTAGSVGNEQATNAYSSENVFEKVLRQVQADPQNEDALYHLADLYDRQGSYQKAVDTYRQVLAINPERAYVYFKMGTAYSRMGQAAQAVEVLSQATVHLPKNPVAWNNLGIAYGKLEQLDKEIEALRRALEIRPRYASARFNLAMTYLKKGDTAAARAQYEELKTFDGTMAQELLSRLGDEEGQQTR